MKKILIVLLFINLSLFNFSCGDPSQPAGKDAAEKYNENTHSGSVGGGTTGKVTPNADTLNQEDNDNNNEDEKVKGSGSAPAD